MKLAKHLIAWLHTPEAAEVAEGEFVKQFVKKDVPDDMPEVPIAPGSYRAAALLVHAKLAASNGEATRKMKEKAVDVGEDKQAQDFKKEYVIDQPTVLRLGRKYVRLVLE